MGNIAKFDAIAQQYDTPERDRVAAAIAGKIHESVGGAAGKTAIDYGCGTGLVGLRLLDLFSEMTFADASENMLAAVREKIRAGGAAGAKTLHADFVANAPNLAADYILLVQVLLHEKDINTLLARLHDALNDGGHLLIVDFDKNDNITSPDVHSGFEQRELYETLESFGFDVMLSGIFYRGEKLFMNQDAALFLIDARKTGGESGQEADQ